MNVSQADAPWSSRRLWIFSALVLSAQLGLIYWLSDYRPPRQRVPRPTPTLQLASQTSREVLALMNPTIFALPRKESFAGLAWMHEIKPAFREVEWREEPYWREPSTNQLGAVFHRFVETNVVRLWHTPSLPEPALLMPTTTAQPLIPNRSAVQLFAEEPGVRLLQVPELPSWPALPISATDFDILTNSVVSVMYGGDGKVLSPILLSSSGSPAADEYALKTSLSMELEVPNSSRSSATNELGQLGWARLVYEWHTVRATNTPAAPAKN